MFDDCFYIIAPSGNQYAPRIKHKRQRSSVRRDHYKQRQGKYISVQDRPPAERVEQLVRLYAAGGQVCTDDELARKLAALIMSRLTAHEPTNQTGGLSVSQHREFNDNE